MQSGDVCEQECKAKRKLIKKTNQNPRENQLYTDPAEQNQMIIWCINILSEIF